MKGLFITIGNFILFFHYITGHFIFVLWYGKLPKVSIYHYYKRNDFYKLRDSYENPNCQVISDTDVPTDIKIKIIDTYIKDLYKDARFHSNCAGMDIPIFDGKEIIGSAGINSILQEVKLKTT